MRKGSGPSPLSSGFLRTQRHPPIGTKFCTDPRTTIRRSLTVAAWCYSFKWSLSEASCQLLMAHGLVCGFRLGKSSIVRKKTAEATASKHPGSLRFLILRSHSMDATSAFNVDLRVIQRQFTALTMFYRWNQSRGGTTSLGAAFSLSYVISSGPQRLEPEIREKTRVVDQSRSRPAAGRQNSVLAQATSVGRYLLA